MVAEMCPRQSWLGPFVGDTPSALRDRRLLGMKKTCGIIPYAATTRKLNSPSKGFYCAGPPGFIVSCVGSRHQDAE